MLGKKCLHFTSCVHTNMHNNFHVILYDNSCQKITEKITIALKLKIIKCIDRNSQDFLICYSVFLSPQLSLHMTKQPMIKGYWVPLYYAISTHCFGSMAEKFPTVFTSCSIQKKTQINQIFYTNNILQRNHFKFLADTLYFPAHKYNAGCLQHWVSHQQRHTQLLWATWGCHEYVGTGKVVK